MTEEGENTYFDHLREATVDSRKEFKEILLSINIKPWPFPQLRF
jgi:hypothetical protein